jgi:chromosome segregation ATPase
MATTTRRKTARSGAARKPAKRPARPKSPEARAALAEIQAGLRTLRQSIGEIQRGLRTAEREIEADARKRIAELRKEARAQLRALQAKSRDVTRSLLAAAPLFESSWDEIKQSADAVLGDARSAASAFAGRIRDAIGR